MIGLMVLLAVAGALTSIWLGGAVIYISTALGWGVLFALPPSELALVVAGTFGPVVALWLIIAFLQQGLLAQRHERILTLMLNQHRRASDQIEAQVRTLIQMQGESRRRSVIDGMDLVLKDLNGQAAVLAERLGMVSPDEADSLWARNVAGDVWAFAYAFLTRAAAYPDFSELLAERLAGDDISSAALQIYLRRYDQLLETFKINDADKLAREVLEDGPLARLHGLFTDVNDRAVRLRRFRDPEALALLAGQESPLPAEAEAR
ncbi:MAG: hypothetical protein WCZ23_10340 [Rhodospirillaceae bacterium]